MIELAVFDMAGTTVNEHNLVYRTLWETINASGVYVEFDTVLQIGAGKEKFQAIYDILEFIGSFTDNASNIYEQFLLALDKAYTSADVSPCLYTEEVFRKLREQDIKIVLNTGYNREIAEKLIGRLGWQQGHEFDLLVTADDSENGRPSPDMILYAMKKLGIRDATNVVKIGDSEIDILEGKNANCGLTIGVLTGAHNSKQLARVNPDLILENLKNLPDILDQVRHP